MPILCSYLQKDASSWSRKHQKALYKSQREQQEVGYMELTFRENPANHLVIKVNAGLQIQQASFGIKVQCQMTVSCSSHHWCPILFCSPVSPVTGAYRTLLSTGHELRFWWLHQNAKRILTDFGQGLDLLWASICNRSDLSLFQVA